MNRGDLMSLLRRIVEWFRELFRKLFGKKVVKKKINDGIKKANNKRYLKGYGVFIEDSYAEMIPPYLVVTKESKKKIKEKISIISEIVATMENNDEITKELDQIIEKIENKSISFYQNEKINDYLDILLEDKDIKTNTREKIIHLDQNILNILDDYGKEIEEKVVNKYKNVNYVTITNVILDETFKDLEQLENDFRHHKYNKYYYNRKLEKILERIENLRKVREYEGVQQEILDLRKELYTKSKDKFDLLFNNEVFDNIENSCNNLLHKVNRRIIDLKKGDKLIKENKEEKERILQDKRKKEQEKKDQEKREKQIQEEKEKELEEKLLKRFKDLDLAQKILFLYQNENLHSMNNKDLLHLLNNYYYDFLNGEKAIFFYDRNKTKTELLKLYNSMNYMECMLQDKDFVFVDHINFRMEDLLNEVMGKKDNLEQILEKKYHYERDNHETSILVDNKLQLLFENEKERNIGQVKVMQKIRENPYERRK